MYQPSVYSEPEPQLVLIDTPTELEKQIGGARETVTGAYRDSYSYVQGWVNKWIGVEHAVERECNIRSCFQNLSHKIIWDRANKELQGS